MNNTAFFRSAAIALSALATLAAAPAPHPGRQPTIRLAVERARVEADDGQGVFFIGRDDYVFHRYGNPERRVIAFDAMNLRVRITPLDQRALWIRCADLEPIAGKCTKARKPRHSGSAGAPPPPPPPPPPGGDSSAAASLPECPGDPRCP